MIYDPNEKQKFDFDIPDDFCDEDEDELNQNKDLDGTKEEALAKNEF
ncbi:hypothetical protein [Bacillus sp. V5-8f]|nr:hypothetical protein [Bacillus sp. V5-8f]